jgi:hypothetical protein
MPITADPVKGSLLDDAPSAASFPSWPEQVRVLVPRHPLLAPVTKGLDGVPGGWSTFLFNVASSWIMRSKGRTFPAIGRASPVSIHSLGPVFFGLQAGLETLELVFFAGFWGTRQDHQHASRQPGDRPRRSRWASLIFSSHFRTGITEGIFALIVAGRLPLMTKLSLGLLSCSCICVLVDGFQVLIMEVVLF